MRVGRAKSEIFARDAFSTESRVHAHAFADPEMLTDAENATRRPPTYMRCAGGKNAVAEGARVIVVARGGFSPPPLSTREKNDWARLSFTARISVGPPASRRFAELLNQRPRDYFLP